MRREMYAIIARGAAALAGLAGAAGAARADLVYFNDFETSSGSLLSKTDRSVTPTGRGFLGEFGNDSVTLGLPELPAHNALRIRFDLYLIRSWDGDQPLVGPDVFAMGMQNGPALVNASFAAQPEDHARPQSFPDPLGMGSHPMGTGAAEWGTLGYMWADVPTSAVYHFDFTVPHTQSNAAFYFEGYGLQAITDESWGLDNIRVDAVPAPGVAGVMGIAGAVMGGRRRRR